MSKTLLLADDSVTIQKVVGISFANEDVVLITVDNGDDAIAKAREARPDIVLADVVMPGKNGYEVCEALKADPDLAHVPVLLLTGTFEAFDETRATAAGADGHVTKPFEAQALVDTVNARLAQAPTVAPVAAAPGPSAEPFDFLEEPTGESSSLPATEAPRTTMIMGEDLAASDEAFSFDPNEGITEPATAPDLIDPHAETDAGFAAIVEEPAGDLTQLVMGSDDLAAAETLPPVGSEAAPTGEPGAGLFADDEADDVTRVVLGDVPPDLPELETDGDFGAPLDLDANDETGSGPFETGIDPLADSGAGVEAVLDPEGAGDYDVSSSDLGDSFSAAMVTPAPEAEPEPAEAGIEPTESEPLLADPLEQSDPGPFATPTTTEVALAEPVFSAPLAPEPEPIEAGTDPEPFDAFGSGLSEDPVEAAPLEEAEPAFAQDAPFEASPAPIEVTGDPASPDLSPMMREQLHDAIEKIAWEAFGDVAERIVQDALARVEEVAWEVIPKMAETLIQEEIRKMKGNS